MSHVTCHTCNRGASMTGGQEIIHSNTKLEVWKYISDFFLISCNPNFLWSHNGLRRCFFNQKLDEQKYYNHSSLSLNRITHMENWRISSNPRVNAAPWLQCPIIIFLSSTCHRAPDSLRYTPTKTKHQQHRQQRHCLASLSPLTGLKR